MPSPKPKVLIILDGWGVAPPVLGNAVAIAKTPNFNNYTRLYPVVTLQASGEAAGLPFGEPGNSEVGHTALGAGKIIYQNLPRITQSIWKGGFFSNPAFLGAIKHAQKNNSSLHLLGLVSSGGVHSYLEHLSALLELVKRQKLKRVYIHAFLDGRDSGEKSGINFITQIEEGLKNFAFGEIATISGRFYAMDRDNHWERVSKVYSAMVTGEADKKSDNPIKAIKESYNRKVYDEEFLPTVIINKKTKNPRGLVKDNDAMIFFNFRPDRARELTSAFISKPEGFSPSKRLKNLFFVTMTEYEEGLPVQVAFPPEEIKNPLPKIISDAGLSQFHIAETEKYAHVTFFFGGGKERSLPGQENVLVPSPRIPSYADQPEMSARKLTEKLIAALKEKKYDFIIINYANPDMVGHTGNLKAGVKAVEFADECLGKIIPEIINQDGFALITADHGNAEEMIKLETGEINKEHSTNPVPCILISKELSKKNQAATASPPDLSKLTPAGILADVAPTFLKVMGLRKPPEMTGHSLL
ncbi:2,3-bisphosphoglycerate-independent phosphoglycerate mutase [Candidatus Falkowbacteria bacterium]|nr:2,3-bisphosphoglycerate-independent phosphoglycerate mutase [Candidatus Falkowbacteria bacterium]